MSSVTHHLLFLFLDIHVCLPSQFKCTHPSRCIPGIFRCNGQDNCGEGEDEKDCRKSSNDCDLSHYSTPVHLSKQHFGPEKDIYHL